MSAPHSSIPSCPNKAHSAHQPIQLPIFGIPEPRRQPLTLLSLDAPKLAPQLPFQEADLVLGHLEAGGGGSLRGDREESTEFRVPCSECPGSGRRWPPDSRPLG